MKFRHLVVEAERELETRARCYPRWVEEGRLSDGLALARLELQKQIVLVLQQFDPEQEVDAVINPR